MRPFSAGIATLVAGSRFPVIGGGGDNSLKYRRTPIGSPGKFDHLDILTPGDRTASVTHSDRVLHALKASAARLGEPEPHGFRRIESHGRIGERAITSAEVARTFQRIASILDLDSTRPISRISAHSIRALDAYRRSAGSDGSRRRVT
jgi:hypothetical protein